MKNKIGRFFGFVFGAVGFLLVFKIVFLKNIAPSDELAPGIVVIASVLNGLIFGFIGSLVQNYFARKGS